jgi:hypothetical protein
MSATRRGKKALGELVEAAAAADRCIRLARRYAFNYSNGDPSVLVAAVIEPGGCPSGETPPDLSARKPKMKTRLNSIASRLDRSALRYPGAQRQQHDRSAGQARCAASFSTGRLGKFPEIPVQPGALVPSRPPAAGASLVAP